MMARKLKAAESVLSKALTELHEIKERVEIAEAKLVLHEKDHLEHFKELKAELAAVKTERDTFIAINAQVAEKNIKLRKALEEISTHGGALKHSDGTETVYTCDPALIARAALGEIK